MGEAEILFLEDYEKYEICRPQYCMYNKVLAQPYKILFMITWLVY